MIFQKSSAIRNGLVAGCAATIMAFTACNKSDSTPDVLPAVETIPVLANVTSTGVQSGGNITDIGSSYTLTTTGICYSATNSNPVITDSKTSEGAIYNFKSVMTGLTPNTTYYVRAYVQNDLGYGYGSVITFKTSATGADTTVTTSTFAGNGALTSANGTGTNASVGNPQGIATDAQGNFYVADSYNHIIRKITPAGVVSTFAGSGDIGFAAGSATTARFYSPQGIAVDANSNVYVTDLGNNAVYKITSAGTVSILAGSGSPGYANGTGTAALFNAPCGIAADAQGNVYVADRNNNRIRKITSTGVVTTFAGIGTAGAVNGDATTVSTFYRPVAVAFDGSGNLFVLDQANALLRKITSGGTVSTILGNAATKSLLNTPAGLIIDAQNNFYITDQSGRVLKITSANILYTLAGKADTQGFADGSKSTAVFSAPAGIALDAAKNIYVADVNNNRIRKLVVQ